MQLVSAMKSKYKIMARHEHAIGSAWKLQFTPISLQLGRVNSRGPRCGGLGFWFIQWLVLHLKSISVECQLSQAHAGRCLTNRRIDITVCLSVNPQVFTAFTSLPINPATKNMDIQDNKQLNNNSKHVHLPDLQAIMLAACLIGVSHVVLVPPCCTIYVGYTKLNLYNEECAFWDNMKAMNIMFYTTLKNLIYCTIPHLSPFFAIKEAYLLINCSFP